MTVVRPDERLFCGLQAQGFTLVELLAVIILLSILAAIAVPRYISLEANADERAIDAAIAELNGREGLLWATVKCSVSGYDPDSGDRAVWGKMKDDPTGTYPNLGKAYAWDGDLVETDGALGFRGSGKTVFLSRTPSTTVGPARWMRHP